MLRFTTLNGKVVYDPSVMMIKEFTDIIDHFSNKKDGEAMANKFLMYVFFCCDLTEQNPLRDVDYRMKEDQANRRAFSGSKPKKFNAKEQVLVDSAIDAYNFFNETALERATLAYDKKIDEMRTLLEKVAPEMHPILTEPTCVVCSENVTTVVEKYVSNAAEIEKFMKMLDSAATYKLKAMETAKKIENTGRVRGDKGSSIIERGVFRDEVENNG